MLSNTRRSSREGDVLETNSDEWPLIEVKRKEGKNLTVGAL